MTISEFLDEESLSTETMEFDAPIDDAEFQAFPEESEEKYPELTAQAILALKPKLMNIINGYFIESLLPEDVFSAFLTKIYSISPKYGLSYVDRYRRTVSHSTYLYTPLRNLCKQLKDRECSECGAALKHAKTIENAPEKEEAYEPSAVYAEHISGGYADERAEEAKDIYSKLMQIAARKYSSASSLSPDGLSRSPYQALQWMYEGMSRQEIAEKLAVSTTYVGLMVDKVLKDPEVESLKVAFNGI